MPVGQLILRVVVEHYGFTEGHPLIMILDALNDAYADRWLYVPVLGFLAAVAIIADVMLNQQERDDPSMELEVPRNPSRFVLRIRLYLMKLKTWLGFLRNPPPQPHPPRLSSTQPATNPFDPWTPAIPPRFKGRAPVLRRLEGALEQSRSVSLVGDWRIGKSSILETWEIMARTMGRTVRRVSSEDSAGASEQAFVHAVTGLPVTGNVETVADGLADWAASNGRPGLLPLLLVDEADRLFTQFEPRFFERMRGMLNQLCFVMATRREIDRICEEQGRTSPFLNRLELIRVGLLEPEAAEQLIASGQPVLQGDDLTTMRRLSGRHPFYLQLLGHHLWNVRRDGDPVQEALDRFYPEARQRLQDWWSILTEPERQALREDSSDNPTIFDALRYRGILTEDGHFFGRVLEDWLREST